MKGRVPFLDLISPHAELEDELMGVFSRAVPVAERVAAEVVSLPLYPQVTAEKQQQVADQIRGFA